MYSTKQIYQQKSMIRKHDIRELINLMNEIDPEMRVENNYDGTIFCNGTIDKIESTLGSCLNKWINEIDLTFPLSMLYHALPLAANQYNVMI